MKITVNLNELNKNLNISLSPEQREKISRYMNRQDLSRQMTVEELKEIERIAFLSKNKDQLDVVLSIDSNDNLKITQGKDTILASIYNNETYINIILDIEENQINKYFESFKVLGEDYVVKKDKFLIDWSQIIQNVELKKQKLLEDIQKGKISNSEIKNVTPDLYNYDIFLASIVGIRAYAKAESKNIKLNKEFLENIEKNLDIVIKHWNYFEHIFHEGKYLNLMHEMTSSKDYRINFAYNDDIRRYILDEVKTKSSKNKIISDFLESYIIKQNEMLQDYEEKQNGVEKNSISFINNLKSISILKENIKTWTEVLQVSQSNQKEGDMVELDFVNLLKKKFSDEKYLKEEASNNFISFFYHYISLNFNNNELFTKELIKKAIAVSEPRMSLLDKLDLIDIDFLIELWNINPRHCATSSGIGKRLSKKKDFIYFLNNITDTSYDALEKLIYRKDLSKKIKEDANILNLLFDKNPDINFIKYCEKVPETIIDRLINENKIDFIREEDLFKKTEKDIIKKIVLSMPKIMLSRYLPDNWAFDKELVYSLPSNILKEFNRSADFWEKFTNGDTCEYEKIINISPNKYLNFNNEIKKNINFFLYAIERDENIKKNIDSYPNEIFLNKEILLGLLPQDVVFTSKIYPILWQDKEFIVSYGKILDNIAPDPYDQREKNNYLKVLPYDIRNLLEIEKIESDYEKFFLNCSLFEVMEDKPKATKRNKI